MSGHRRRILFIAFLVSAILILSVGSFWAFERGGLDFNVFYHAWKLVLEGQGARIYVDSPDRYLYAPGFAWLLAPLGWLPRGPALLFWCFAKATAVLAAAALVGRRAAQAQDLDADLGATCGLAAVLLLARPLLIDFQYGQVNGFILGACVWALLNHVDQARTAKWADVASWMALSLAAAAKIFPLPLLLVPWIAASGVPNARLRRERAGVILGLAIILILPFLAQGWHGGWDLLFAWKTALESKGLPLESHNQSFSAFLHHFFTGESTQVNALAGARAWGFAILSPGVARALSVLWTACTGLMLLAWLAQPLATIRRRDPLLWLAVAIALLIVPSHLVWKPYFLMGVPAAALLALRFRHAWWIPLSVFLLVNFTTFDVVGPGLASRLEAGSLLLWVHLAMTALLIRKGSAVPAGQIVPR